MTEFLPLSLLPIPSPSSLSFVLEEAPHLFLFSIKDIAAALGAIMDFGGTNLSPNVITFIILIPQILTSDWNLWSPDPGIVLYLSFHVCVCISSSHYNSDCISLSLTYLLPTLSH